jgi:hypothetical protein
VRVPYSVSIPVWSSLDGQLQPIEVTMEVIPDVISNLSRVDTAIGPLNVTKSEVCNLTAAAYESSPGTSVSGRDVVFYVHALDQYGNALDAVEMSPAVDVFRFDTAGQERQDFQVLPLTTVQDGFPGLLQGAHGVQTLSSSRASTCYRPCPENLARLASGTIENVKPAGQYRVFVRYALLDDRPEPLAAYPSGGVVTDPTQLQGSALAFTIERKECADPDSQTTNSDGDLCVCKQGFFDTDLLDDELICEACAVGTYRDNIQQPFCSNCDGTYTTVSNASTAASDCVCDVG